MGKYTVDQINISILAVLADRDEEERNAHPRNNYFNPRGPCGPRLAALADRPTITAISILAVLADRDR